MGGSLPNSGQETMFQEGIKYFDSPTKLPTICTFDSSLGVGLNLHEKFVPPPLRWDRCLKWSFGYLDGDYRQFHEQQSVLQ
ncbi:MAG: hypothetical protein ACLUH6_12605 [Bacteroides faecis]